MTGGSSRADTMSWPSDTIEHRGSATIQHGPNNDRIYLMKLPESHLGTLINDLNALAAENNYTKIFTRVPECSAEPFLEDGFVEEARADGLFYENPEDCCFLGKFISLKRRKDIHETAHSGVLELARKAAASPTGKSLPEDFVIRRCSEEDAPEMARIYASVYESYPFPIDRESFLRDTMQESTAYYCAERCGHIAALASMEVDTMNRCAEMTDFATPGEFRGLGLASALLARLQQEAMAMGIRSAFTIARAISPGMNIAFARAGYSYGGRLINNTQISGRIESMNVWHRKLQGKPT